MAFPASPTNGQTTTINGVIYTYNSTKGAWTVTSDASASGITTSTVTASGTVSASTFSGAGTSLTGTGSSFTAGKATNVVVTDSRATATTPQTIDMGVAFDFKQNATEGLSDGGTYFGEMTLRQYGTTTDWSGGLSHQLGFTDNGNVWQRSGSNTTWGSWKKLLDSNNYSSYALPLTGGSVSGQITSTVANGTAPFVVASTTKVANLNVEQVDGYHADTANTASTIAVRDASGVLTAGGFNAAAGTATVAPIDLTAGTNLTTPLAGAVEFDGVCMYGTIDTTNGRGIIPTTQYYRLTADLAATATTISPFYGTNSAIPLVANGIYEIEFYCSFLKTTAGTLVWTFTNSTTVTNMVIWADSTPITGSSTTGTWGAASTALLRGQTAAAVAFPATGSLTTAVYHSARFKVILENGASTSIRLNVTNSAGTVTPGRGSYWKARRLSATNNSTYAA